MCFVPKRNPSIISKTKAIYKVSCEQSVLSPFPREKGKNVVKEDSARRVNIKNFYKIKDFS